MGKTVEGSRIGFAIETTVAAEGEGARLTYRAEADPGLGGVFGRIADKLVEKAYQRQVHADLATLAEILTEHRKQAPGEATG